MELTLYTNSADTKVVDKGPFITSVASLTSVNLAPTDGVTVENPTFICDYNPAILNCNYAWCNTFKRYYFIKDMIVEPGKKIEIICEVDPLMSFKNQIKNCMACVTRSESIGHPTEIVDDRLPIDPNKKEMLSQVSVFNKTAGRKYFFVSLRYGGKEVIV